MVLSFPFAFTLYTVYVVRIYGGFDVFVSLNFFVTRHACRLSLASSLLTWDASPVTTRFYASVLLVVRIWPFRYHFYLVLPFRHSPWLSCLPCHLPRGQPPFYDRQASIPALPTQSLIFVQSSPFEQTSYRPLKDPEARRSSTSLNLSQINPIQPSCLPLTQISHSFCMWLTE
jgi:hypothetical protein